MTNQGNGKIRKHIWISEIALSEEDSIARQLDNSGYAGMIKSNGEPNRSAIVDALYMMAAGRKKEIPRKDEKNREE